MHHAATHSSQRYNAACITSTINVLENIKFSLHKKCAIVGSWDGNYSKMQ